MDKRVIDLARRQHGAFARWQLVLAVAADVVDDTSSRRLESGAWLPATPGVYRLASHPDTWWQRLWIGVLAVGPMAVVSHESAAEIHGMEGARRGLVTLTAPHRWHHRIPGAVVHQSTDLVDDWVTVVDGLRVTTPARTVVDLAAVLPLVRLGHLAEHAHNRRIVSLTEVGQCLATISRRGKRGMGRMARALDAHGPKRIPPMSELERLFFQALEVAGQPPPVRQFAVPGRQVVRGCTDGAYPDAKLILEVDGRAWHTRIKQMKLDRDRDNEAARAGWQTLRFLWEHAVGDPEGTASTVGEVRQLRLALLHPDSRGNDLAQERGIASSSVQ